MHRQRWENTYRISAEEVLRMIDRDVLEGMDKLELLDGALVVKEPQGSPHAAIAADLASELARIYAGVGHVRTHSPVSAGEYSLPEPDIVVVRGSPRDYVAAHPSGRDVILVVELSETSRRRDRAKVRIYGEGQVPVHWLVDFPARRVEIRSHPTETGAYRDLEIHGPGSSIPLPERDDAFPAARLYP